jgi:hypothetical protein
MISKTIFFSRAGPVLAMTRLSWHQAILGKSTSSIQRALAIDDLSILDHW